ncbi:hypothetical protein OE88DRAFT_812277 [Heliocybe sulcata]|uniref:Uncharacterized protein n=1 Tax=Heliocybe sulcata TaxID=5364 RepID=A0A5C3MQC2_9AGAM|nr:hypothetical protein OE88DRAFT_812277 [Heliocybe sulcata]
MSTSAEVTRGRTITRESAMAGILLVKPIKVRHESKFGIPLGRYIEAQKAPCLDGVASWIMNPPLSFRDDCGCRECRRIRRDIYMPRRSPGCTKPQDTLLPKSLRDAGVQTLGEDDIGVESMSIIQPTIHHTPTRPARSTAKRPHLRHLSNSRDARKDAGETSPNDWVSYLSRGASLLNAGIGPASPWMLYGIVNTYAWMS